MDKAFAVISEKSLVRFARLHKFEPSMGNIATYLKYHWQCQLTMANFNQGWNYRLEFDDPKRATEFMLKHG